MEDRKKYQKMYEKAFILFLIEKLPEDSLKANIANRALWYKRHAGIAKVWYFVFFILVLLLNSLTIFLSSLDGFDSFLGLPGKSVYALIAICVNITLSISGLFHFKENWLQYRKSVEQIKRECNLYINLAGEYCEFINNEPGAKNLFCKNIEKICAEEAKAWIDMYHKDKDCENPTPTPNT